MWTHNAPGPLPENPDGRCSPWAPPLRREGALQVLLLSVCWGLAHPPVRGEEDEGKKNGDERTTMSVEGEAEGIPTEVKGPTVQRDASPRDARVADHDPLRAVQVPGGFGRGGS